MMQKTLRKSKNENQDKRKSYIVTETGLVESSDNIDKDDRRGSTKTLLSAYHVQEAKNKLKSLAERRKSMAAGSDDQDSKKNVDKNRVKY